MESSSPVPIPTKRVLFLALSGIGNYLIQAPTIAAYKKEHPQSEITVWVAPRGSKAIAEIDPNVTHVIEAPIRRSLLFNGLHIWRLARRKFDIAIMLSPGQLWKGSVFMFCAFINIRIAHRYPHLGNPESSFLLTAATPELPHVHDIEQNLELLGQLGIDRGAYKYQPYSLPPLPPLSVQQGERIIARLTRKPNQLLVGIHPGSAPQFHWKRWPSEHFITTAKEIIIQHQAFILIFGGPAEQSLAADIQRKIGREATVITAPLLTTAAILKHCSLMISNDSGLMHLAAASGIPTIGLFGPTDEELTGPRGTNSRALRAPGTKPIYNTEDNFDLGKDSHESLQALKPDAVLAAVRQILN